MIDQTRNRIEQAEMRAEHWPLPLFVPGSPALQGSQRYVGYVGHGRMIESSEAEDSWRERVVSAVRAEHWPLLFGPVSVDLTFVIPRPEVDTEDSHVVAIKRLDLNKLARAILDALTSIVFEDDAQVVELVANKRLADPGCQPGVWITVALV